MAEILPESHGGHRSKYIAQVQWQTSEAGKGIFEQSEVIRAEMEEHDFSVHFEEAAGEDPPKSYFFITDNHQGPKIPERAEQEFKKAAKSQGATVLLFSSDGDVGMN